MTISAEQLRVHARTQFLAPGFQDALNEAAAEIERLSGVISDERNRSDELATLVTDLTVRMTFIKGGDIPATVEAARAALVLKEQRLIGENERLSNALRALLTAATEARWPLTADHMLPMNLARAALSEAPK